MNDRSYWVYIVSNRRRTVLYVGITNNLSRRMNEHRMKPTSCFTSWYNCTDLLHAERFDDVRDAIEREKQIKGYRREKKLALIRTSNPAFIDLTPGIS